MSVANTAKKQQLRTTIGCLVVMFCVGIIYLWSVLKADVVLTYGWTVPSANMVASYMLMGFVLGCLLGGILTDRKGPRFTAFAGVIVFSLGIGLTGVLTAKQVSFMYITYSALGGLGAGLAYNSTIACLQKWMPQSRGLASGLAAAAFGLSTTAFTPLCRVLMERFRDENGVVNFRPVFVILAVLFLIVGLVACSLITAPSAAAKIAEKDKSLTTRQAFRTLPFWCLFGSMFLVNGTWNLAVPLIKDLGMERGLSESYAVLAVSLTGIFSAVGRLICACLSDKLGRIPTLLVLTATTLVGALLLTGVGGFGYLAVILVLSFCYGGPSPVHAAFCTDFFGTRYAGTNYGCIMMALGFSSIFFNTISNRLLAGNPVPTFLMGAVSALLAVLCQVVLRRYEKAAAKR